MRIAYEVDGECNPSEGLEPMMIPGNHNFQYWPQNLCLVDIGDKTEPN
jgi:hypothetical protein